MAVGAARVTVPLVGGAAALVAERLRGLVGVALALALARAGLVALLPVALLPVGLPVIGLVRPLRTWPATGHTDSPSSSVARAEQVRNWRVMTIHERTGGRIRGYIGLRDRLAIFSRTTGWRSTRTELVHVHRKARISSRSAGLPMPYTWQVALALCDHLMNNNCNSWCMVNNQGGEASYGKRKGRSVNTAGHSRGS